MLLVGAGLLINSFWRLLQTDAGFDAKGVLALDIPLSRTQYTKPDQRSAAFEQRDWHSHGARAKRADVLRLVVRQGMTMTLIGLGIGLAGAFSLSRVLRGMLHGVSPTDTLTFAGVSIVLLAVALLACLIPARRATRVDPIVALRNRII